LLRPTSQAYVDQGERGGGVFDIVQILPRHRRSGQFGRTAAPMVPQLVHAIFGPNEGTVVR
jgi:hypothetical protein